jgi:hypothetical protein
LPPTQSANGYNGREEVRSIELTHEQRRVSPSRHGECLMNVRFLFGFREPLMVFGILSSIGCSAKSPEVRYVLPNDYRGAFVVYTGQADGVSLERTGQRYTVIIPPKGILRVKEKAPFYDWHTTTASFSTGDVIPIGNDEMDQNTVAFWHGGSRPGGLVYEFIGTKLEWLAFREKTASAEIAVGGIRKPAPESP